MREVSTFRLHLLRGTYLLVAVGLGVQIWPGILHGSPHVEHMRGVVRSLLGAVSLLAVVGLRYPLKMLPLLLFELMWKSIWVVAIGLPCGSATDSMSPHERHGMIVSSASCFSRSLSHGGTYWLSTPCCPATGGRAKGLAPRCPLRRPGQAQRPNAELER